MAAVDSSLVVHDNIANFDGSSSSDAEMDALTCRWIITSAPATSTAVLVDADTATPSLAPELEGIYSLTLSDFLGDGVPTEVEFTATIASEFAEVIILDGYNQVAGLTLDQVTTKGKKMHSANT